MTGKEMCGLSKEEFCTRAPVFVGDILWEHLVLLQQDVDREKAALKNAPSNLSETSTDPVSLPPSPPTSQTMLYQCQSPQKTYHTLSPQRHYAAPTPPLTYTNLDTSAMRPATNTPPVTIKSEYPPAPVPVTSHMPTYNQYQQYQTYQRLSHPYQHYPGYNVYDMQAAAVSQQYPAFPQHPVPTPAPVPVTGDQAQVTGQRWTGSSGHSYQVRIISHYQPHSPAHHKIILFKDNSHFLVVHPPSDTPNIAPDHSSSGSLLATFFNVIKTYFISALWPSLSTTHQQWSASDQFISSSSGSQHHSYWSHTVVAVYT